MTIGFADVKEAMRGREEAFLSQYLNSKQLNGKNQPCPHCGGRDRYRHIKNSDGGFYCSSFDKKMGDVFDHVGHTQNMTMAQVLGDAKIFLGLEDPTPKQLQEAKERKALFIEKQKRLERLEFKRHQLRSTMNDMFFYAASKGEIEEDEKACALKLYKQLKEVYGD